MKNRSFYLQFPFSRTVYKHLWFLSILVAFFLIYLHIHLYDEDPSEKTERLTYLLGVLVAIHLAIIPWNLTTKRRRAHFLRKMEDQGYHAYLKKKYGEHCPEIQELRQSERPKTFRERLNFGMILALPILAYGAVFYIWTT